MSTPTQTPGASKRKPERRGQARSVVAITVAVLITLFAVLNVEDVRVHWIVGTSETPLIIVIAVSAIAGALLAVFAERRRRSGGR
jgi:uncharacterized integral membrane protein